MAGPIIEPANFIFLIFLNFLLYFLAGIIIEPVFFSTLFFKQRRHSRQNVHSDDSFLGRFRPSHAGSQHHSMGGKSPHVHEFVGLYSDPQCDAGTITAVVTYVFFRLNIPLNKFRRQCYKFRSTVLQVSQTVLQVSQTVLQVSQTVLRWSWQHEWTENVCC